MSKRSRRPGREAFKEQRRARKKAQRQLRQRQQTEGLSAPARPSLPNRKCPYQDQQEEREARLDAVSQQIQVYRSQLPVLLKRLSKIKEPRNPRKIKHKLTVLIIYGILCFAFQMSSRRQANQQMTRPMFEANLRQLFPDLDELPHQDTLARLLARIEVNEIEQALVDMLRGLMRKKKFRRYLIGGCYPIAIDGTQKFTRAQCWDTACLERKVGAKKAEASLQEQEPDKQYYVYVLEANLAFENGMVIPLLSEILSDTEGDQPKDKQDCEQKAFRRLAQRLKECFSHLPVLLLLDGLYPNGPIIELCHQYHWDFMIVLQDGSLPTLWEEMEGFDKLQPPPAWKQKWGERRQHFRWYNNLEYVYSDPATGRPKQHRLHVVICQESWEEIAPQSTAVVQKNSRHVWISAEPLHQRNVHSRCNLGARHRWGIEAGLLVEKHHGYQYEHCFSYTWEAMRGYHYLMRLGHALNVLARYSAALAKYVRELGVRGLIDFVRQTLAGPWFTVEQLQQIATAPCQLRLE
jgi:hypothetical protein